MKDIVSIWVDIDDDDKEKVVVRSKTYPEVDNFYAKDRRGVRKKIIRDLKKFYIEDYPYSGKPMIKPEEIERFVNDAWDIDPGDQAEELVINVYPKGLGAGTASFVMDSVDDRVKDVVGTQIGLVFAVVRNGEEFKVVIAKDIITNPQSNLYYISHEQTRMKARYPNASIYSVHLPVSYNVKGAEFMGHSEN